MLKSWPFCSLRVWYAYFVERLFALCHCSMLHSHIFSKSSLLSHISLGCYNVRVQHEIRSACNWNAIIMQLTCIALTNNRRPSPHHQSTRTNAAKQRDKICPFMASNKIPIACRLIAFELFSMLMLFSIQHRSLPSFLSVRFATFRSIMDKCT